MIKVTVKFFAFFREQLGISAIDVECAQNSRVQDVLNRLYQDFPRLAEMVKSQNTLCAVNHQLVGLEHALNNGDEVAFLPPVTGG
ncbi:MoaD/ThiS family protein [Alteromonas flava]|uniref:MoaD/ThiS family protein n=1 Tax=Alteromonas flava TaxID=2048003 RepID=UPI0013DD6A16|nr:MoaD/ThiS family protein [Alteromonas flava]